MIINFKLKSKQSAFQLVEVMIALVILGIAFGSLILLSTSSSGNLRKSADLLMAISLAQLVMEKSKSLPYDLIDDSDFSKIYQDNNSNSGIFNQFEALDDKIYAIEKEELPNLYKQLQSMDYQYKIEVEKVNNSVDSKLIQVTIQWINKGNQLQYQLNGYLSKRV
ncbi:MAG: hypothetical protein COB02_05785 [Candidatus Cloacimonadota bacterium]|nr:MAG: hypothetical protein COB02_05785 [Candidatus Cloacimonadota bacterium]